MPCVTRSGLVLPRGADGQVNRRSRSSRPSDSPQLVLPSLLVLPDDVLQRILAVLELSEEGIVSHGKVAEGLAAFRCASKAAQRVADGAVKNMRFDVGNFVKLGRNMDHQEEERIVAVLREDLRRWPMVAHLSPHLLPVLEFTLANQALPVIASENPHLRHLTISRPKPHLPTNDFPSQHFPPFHHLQTLTLSGLGLQTEDFPHLVSLPSLHTLTLHLCNNYPTDVDIPTFPRLCSLTVTMSHFPCPVVSLSTSPDAPWSSLHTLTLEGCPSRAPWAPPATAFPALNTLRILRGLGSVHPDEPRLLTSLRDLSLGFVYHGFLVTAARLSDPISTLHSLRSLQITNMNVGTLRPLEHLTSLETLTLRHTRATTLRRVATLSALRSLHIDLQVGDVPLPLAAIAKAAPPLEALHLSHCALRRKDRPAIAQLQTLTSLTLVRVKTPELPPLDSLSRLQHLSLKNLMFLTPACLGDLASLRTLEVERVSLFSFVQVTRLTALEALHLCCTHDDVGGSLDLKNLGRLRSLTLRNLHGLTSLKGMKKLTALETFLLSDRKLLPNLAPLTALTGLRRLELKRTLNAELPPVGGLTALQSLVVSQLCNAKPVGGLELCSRLKRVHLHRGNGSCVKWLRQLPWLEEVRFEDLPKGAWAFSSPGGQRLVVRGRWSGLVVMKGKRLVTEGQMQNNLQALRGSLVAAGMVELGEAEVEDNFVESEDWEEKEDDSDDEDDEDDEDGEDEDEEDVDEEVDEEDEDEDDDEDDDEDEEDEDEEGEDHMGLEVYSEDDEDEDSDDDDMGTDEDEDSSDEDYEGGYW